MKHMICLNCKQGLLVKEDLEYADCPACGTELIDERRKSYPREIKKCTKHDSVLYEKNRKDLNGD